MTNELGGHLGEWFPAERIAVIERKKTRHSTVCVESPLLGLACHEGIFNQRFQISQNKCDEVIENPGLTSSLGLVSFGSYEDEIQICENPLY